MWHFILCYASRDKDPPAAGTQKFNHQSREVLKDLLNCKAIDLIADPEGLGTPWGIGVGGDQNPNHFRFNI